jgi:hypothetical protein
MALIKCTECQQTISDKAVSCPHCGAPRNAMEVPPPLPPSRPQQTQKKGSIARQAAVYILAGLGEMFFLLYLIGDNQKPSPPAAQVSDSERAAIAAKREADELASKKAEEARCDADLKCIGDKKSIEATFRCVPYVERLATNNFEWIDKWYEPKFSHFRWKDQGNLVVTYLGDKIKYQNGFGGWVLSRYECDYSIRTGTVLDVRASAGRLPP